MAGRDKGPLTEPMYYVLMSFQRRELCGTEITEFVETKTAGRVRLGPGTLYTILSKFEEEALIRETSVEGRRRTYAITERGRGRYRAELERLRACIRDAEAEEGRNRNA